MNNDYHVDARMANSTHVHTNTNMLLKLIDVLYESVRIVAYEPATI